MNVDVAVVIESHLMRRAEGDLVIWSGSGFRTVNQARFGHEDLIRLLIRKNLCESLTCEK